MLMSFGDAKSRNWWPSISITRPQRLTATVAIGLCSIACLTWLLPALSVKSKLGRLLPSDSVESEPQSHWGNNPRRLVVFGDSWSDNGQYPMNPPPSDRGPSRQEARGKAWTEWLCDTISCTHHDNFASNNAVVDSILWNKTMLNTTNFNNTLNTDPGLEEPLSDLTTQIQQWLAFETQQNDTSRNSQVERNGTVFIIWFSLWDLWYYSEKNMADAQYAVTRAMDVLFEQLSVIVENWPAEVKIIIPEAIDATFLPRWQRLRTGPGGTDPMGENQRNAVLLVEQWNRALDRRASGWQSGSMYIYNTNEWLLDQIRERQLSEARLADANGLGTAQSPWTNVHSGCMDGSTVKSGDASQAGCSNPNSYLFWDEWLLGPEAMKMIGQGIAQDIASNGGSQGWFTHEVGSSHEEKDKDKADAILPERVARNDSSLPVSALPTNG